MLFPWLIGSLILYYSFSSVALLLGVVKLWVCFSMLFCAEPIYSLTGSIFILGCFIMALSIPFGISLGTFGAVEFALALNVIPNKDNSATFLGMSAIIRFLGESVGSAVVGVALQGFVNFRDEAGVVHYGLDGYFMIIALVVLGCVNCALFIHRIPKNASVPLSVGRSVTVDPTLGLGRIPSHHTV